MHRHRRIHWYFVWLPLVLAAGILPVLVALVLLGPTPPEAHAAGLTAKDTAGFQTTDKLIVTVNLPAREKKLTGALRVELVGPEDTILAEASREVTAKDDASSQRFEFPSPKIPAHKINLRCRFADEAPVEVPLSQVLLVKAHETTLASGQEFYAGSTATLRCEVHGVKSLTETVPLAGSTVEVKLRDKDGKATPVYSGKVGADGVAAVEFKVPALPSGQYKMEVATKSDLGEEKLEREVKVKSAPKVLLVTDKPLYQPGQIMHIRALALQSFDLKPVEKSELVFEVEDAKGNKVFKRDLKTSEFGIASVDFQLADEVNQGDYHIRAILGDQQADKTVTVKPYVLPKFKSEVTADKKFYLPKETIHADLQTDYFFGKPVAGGKVRVSASTFDVAFKEFQIWEGTTDAAGHVKFEVKLPDYFVGQPLSQGNALVKLEVKITDTADHTETIHKTYPVSDQAVRVSLIPEGGRLVPGMENRIFAAAIYPDGSPAQCDVNIWTGQSAKGKPYAALKTNESGLAEFRLQPKPEQFRAGEWANRQIEMLGGQNITVGGQKSLFDLFAEAKDANGNAAKTAVSLTSEPFGENLLLRLDKAIYKGGDSLKVDIHTTAGLPTAYLDVLRGGQVLLTKWLDVKDGKADYKLDLPPSVFGTLEVHAYQMLATGEIIRDSRVVYVNPSSDLKIDVQANKDVYLPGEQGTIRFTVTDANGKPTSAALGILIVDEAVYALQEMQPGLEKVYFTLQEELVKPQAQAVYKPGEPIDQIVREPILTDAKQQIAEVLLTSIKPKAPAEWTVDPAVERRRKMDNQLAQIGSALYQHAFTKPFMVQDKNTKKWSFAPDLLKDVIQEKLLDANALTDPVGGTLTLESLARLDKEFTVERLARAVSLGRMQQLHWPVVWISNNNQAKWLKDGKWTLPETILADAAKAQNIDASHLKDAWGNPFKMVKRDKKRDNSDGITQFDSYDMVSAGPDGKVGTEDDVTLPSTHHWQATHLFWLAEDSREIGQGQGQAWLHRRELLRLGEAAQFDRAKQMDGNFARGGLGGGGFPPQAGAPGGAPRPEAKDAAGNDNKKNGTGLSTNGPGGGPPAMRLREYFPETLLWQPALITDDKGVAVLPLNFADSVTTWRLTASASSRGGSLGGTTLPLRVFQDFFVDLDLPLFLTQNDEVAFPVAVYNYLKEPQTVKLDLQPEAWFELTDKDGYTRSLDLKPGEVTSVKFRIKAKRIGNFPLTVKAQGSKMSDAIKRGIDVAPDGKKIEQVVSDRLNGKVTQSIIIPDNAIPDASKFFVKVYPGVFSQILEGTEGMIRLPGG
jgi:hypothetical protein